MAKFNKKVVLVIMDGWGIAKPDKYNAIDNAKTPNVDRLIREYPNIQLRADGPFVGLPEGQFGTSEINHQVIGTGQVVLQDLPRIDKAIEDETFYSNKVFVNACEQVRTKNSALHIVGIASDGKVHCSLDHMLALIKLADREKVENVYIHAFADGRDTPPKSTEKYLKIIQKELEGHDFKHASIATLQGRFYLDRDREWSKTEKAIDLIFRGDGMKVNDYQGAVNFSYNKDQSDEFFDQYLIDEKGLVKDNDVMVFTHYRTDRMHQIVSKAVDQKVQGLKIVTMIRIYEDCPADVAFPRLDISQTLSGSISEAGKKQLHITETEKYTHLTFFLNAGRDHEYEGEEWVRLQSNRFVKPFYNFAPSMQSAGITERVLEAIEKDEFDFIIINYSNTDMVGHTGNYEAAVVAAESVDYAVGKLYEALEEKLDKYALLVTADHGNSDEMWDYEANQPHTQHTTNPVPFILVSDIDCKLDKKESLEDIAPTVLDLMGLEKPEVMTGTSLIIEN